MEVADWRRRIRVDIEPAELYRNGLSVGFLGGQACDQHMVLSLSQTCGMSKLHKVKVSCFFLKSFQYNSILINEEIL
jgi:hypothetical protein